MLNYIENQRCIFPSIQGIEDEDKDEDWVNYARSYIGSTIILYNNTGKNIAIIGALTSYEEDVGNFESIIVGDKNFVTATCKIRAGLNGKEQVFWLYRIGKFK